MQKVDDEVKQKLRVQFLKLSAIAKCRRAKLEGCQQAIHQAVYQETDLNDNKKVAIHTVHLQQGCPIDAKEIEKNVKQRFQKQRSDYITKLKQQLQQLDLKHMQTDNSKYGFLKSKSTRSLLTPSGLSMQEKHHNSTETDKTLQTYKVQLAFCMIEIPEIETFNNRTFQGTYVHLDSELNQTIEPGKLFWVAQCYQSKEEKVKKPFEVKNAFKDEGAYCGCAKITPLNLQTGGTGKLGKETAQQKRGQKRKRTSKRTSTVQETPNKKQKTAH